MGASSQRQIDNRIHVTIQSCLQRAHIVQYSIMLITNRRTSPLIKIMYLQLV